MPKRSEKRDTAKAEYIAKKKKGEEVSLRTLAGELGVSYQTLRNWKAADKWEEALPKKKRGGQPGNQNSKGKQVMELMDQINYLGAHKTRKEIIIAIPNRKAETVVKALDALERKLGARRFRAIFKSITFDNGTEFAAAEELERSCVNKHLPRTKVYFCHPYSSWERGTNENTNGMIRRRFPKGTNFAAVTNAQIVQAENWINNYPRKILGYKSSEIVFRECLRELGIAA